MNIIQILFLNVAIKITIDEVLSHQSRNETSVNDCIIEILVNRQTDINANNRCTHTLNAHGVEEEMGQKQLSQTSANFPEEVLSRNRVYFN